VDSLWETGSSETVGRGVGEEDGSPEQAARVRVMTIRRIFFMGFPGRLEVAPTLAKPIFVG
jgi:hypothetical protein